MRTSIPGLGEFWVVAGVEDKMPDYSSSDTPERSESVVVLLMHPARRSVQDSRRLRVAEAVNTTLQTVRYDTGFVMSETQARELAECLIAQANALAES